MMKATKKEAIEEGITEAVAESLVCEEDSETPVEVAEENVIESGVDQIAAEGKQSETDSGTKTDSY